MAETLARDYGEFRLSLDESLRVFDAKELAKPREGTRAAQKDAYTDFLPSKPEPKVVPLSSIPTLPSPEPASLTGKKRKQEEDIQQVVKKAKVEEEEVFKPVGPFGMPFNTSDGSEIGMTPHPQLVMAKTLEDCTKTMAVGRNLATQTILKVDHVEQDTISREFDEKLKESIEKAKEMKNLSYLQTALQFVTITVGIAGGVMVQLASASSGNPWGVAYGLEMTVGGLLSLGSFCLDQIGYKGSTWTSLMAIGGALMSAHGGLMSAPFLADKLPETLASFYSGTITLLNGYSVFQSMGNEADMTRFSGELTELQKKKKEATDDMKKHYGALNITDFKHLFKAAVDFVDQTNQAAKKVVQGTLKG